MKALRAIFATLSLYLALDWAKQNTTANLAMEATRRDKLRHADAAATSISAVGTIALGIVIMIIAAVVGLRVLASLFPTFSGSVANISTNFTTADWGDTTANDLSPIFALVVALVGLIAFVSLVLTAVDFKRD